MKVKISNKPDLAITIFATIVSTEWDVLEAKKGEFHITPVLTYVQNKKVAENNKGVIRGLYLEWGRWAVGCGVLVIKARKSKEKQ